MLFISSSYVYTSLFSSSHIYNTSCSTFPCTLWPVPVGIRFFCTPLKQLSTLYSNTKWNLINKTRLKDRTVNSLCPVADGNSYIYRIFGVLVLSYWQYFTTYEELYPVPTEASLSRDVQPFLVGFFSHYFSTLNTYLYIWSLCNIEHLAKMDMLSTVIN